MCCSALQFYFLKTFTEMFVMYTNLHWQSQRKFKPTFVHGPGEIPFVWLSSKNVRVFDCSTQISHEYIFSMLKLLVHNQKQ